MAAGLTVGSHIIFTLRFGSVLLLKFNLEVYYKVRTG